MSRTKPTRVRRDLASSLSSEHGPALRAILKSGEAGSLDRFEDAVSDIWRGYRQAAIAMRDAPLAHRLYNLWDGLTTTEVLELLDFPETPEHVRARILEQLGHFNRLSRFAPTVLRALGPRLTRLSGAIGRPVRVLEIGCGDGNFCAAMSVWSREHGVPLEITGGDLFPETVEQARANLAAEHGDVALEVIDALDMRGVEGGAYDLAICLQTLHHFRPGKVARAMAEAARVSRLGFFMVDVARIPALLTISRLGLPLLYDEAFVHDALISVRKAYSRSDLLLLASLASHDPRVRLLPPFHTLVEGGAGI